MTPSVSQTSTALGADRDAATASEAAAATPFLLDSGSLMRLAEEHARAYREAKPYPHAVFDDFVPQAIVDACVAEFPASTATIWDYYSDEGRTEKLALSDEAKMGPVTRQVVAQLNGPTMIAFLERLTGIKGLVPDPNLLGGGLHQLDQGGFLDVHADFNVHPKLRLDRRLNVLLYLNQDWQEDWGGQFEMWDEHMEACRKSVLPVAGRLVCFNTTSTSFHGNPQPIAGPPGTARRSLAFYYYTNGRPAEERQAAHSTLYQERGRAPGGHPTVRRGGRMRALARDLTPPVLVRAARRFRARRGSSDKPL